MAVTLLEAAKSYNGTVRESALIEIYPRTSPVLQLLGFESIAGNSYAYSTEHILPGIGFRHVNAGFDESTGVINPQTEVLKIAGGDLDVDLFIIKTMGEAQRDRQERMKLKALALGWTRTFFKGSSLLDPRVFDGLEVRLGGSQVIDNGTAGLKFMQLDAAIDAVEDPNVIFMNKRLQRRLSYGEQLGVAGSISQTKDELGRLLTTYQGIPIYTIDKDEADQDILGFTEAGSTSSIYVCSIGEGKLHGIQNGDIDVRDLGEARDKPVMRTRVEWYCGIALEHGRGAARLSGITDAPATFS